jgi:hypothetical protein
LSARTGTRRSRTTFEKSGAKSTFGKGGAKSVATESTFENPPLKKVEPNADESEELEQVTMEGYVSKVQDYKRYLADQILGSTF